MFLTNFSYNTYWAKDPDGVTPKAFVNNYFHETYGDCRLAFLRGVDRLVSKYTDTQAGKLYIDNEQRQVIDWCYIPQRGTKERLLILNSGLHGIEGYVGNAFQCLFMDEVLNSDVLNHVGVLIIHGINPYGFQNGRKTTGNNVDLNRNCLLTQSDFTYKNAGYAELVSMLMPDERVNLKSDSNRFFLFRSMLKIIKESKSVMRQAILQGQYEYEKGFCYGGAGHEPHLKELKILLIDKIRQYPSMLNIDIHTAYGERGKIHLFVNRPSNDKVTEVIGEIFKDRKVDWGDSKGFYEIKGDYVSWVNSLVPETFSIPMLFECGTMNSQTTFGSIKSLQIMILENQGAHYGFVDEHTESTVKKQFREMYYPSSSVWRTLVLSDAQTLLKQTIEGYVNFNPKSVL
ncbi:M14 family metallopeptidase [Carboxylicivirga sp. RSCT41]|uniref:M14 family metallopeptidase n=1 Tax=Carboxylicivirga agarovorans TaxID=3417570 RepID=UPI003D334CAA